jgi:MFS family permease
MIINRVIKILIGAGLLIAGAAGFVDPVFAIFVADSIEGGSVQTAGTAIAIYWLVKSVLRVFIAYFLDKRKGEKDDFYAMVIGFAIYGLCYYLYIFATIPAHVYFIQILMGVAGAVSLTPWYGFFSRHIDKDHENLEWSIDTSLEGLCISGAGLATGFIAEHYGFNYVFFIGGSLTLLGALLLALIRKNIETSRNRFDIHLTIKDKTERGV